MIDGIAITMKSLSSEEKGKLNDKYITKLSWQVELFCSYSIKLIARFLNFATIVIFLGLSIHDFINFRWITFYIFSPLYVIGMIISINSLLIGFSSYYITITYLQYRFEQLNEKIQSSDLTLNRLLSHIREHNRITCLHVVNNQFMTKVLFGVYFFYPPTTDIALFLSIYSQMPLFMKIIIILATIVMILFLFLFSLNIAMLCKSAHLPYKRINSFVAKQSQSKMIETRQNIKLLNFIERLGGPDIAVYCLDLFPLNYYEFYLFIAAISVNFSLPLIC